MEDGVPVITLVKKGEIGPRPPLSSESEALERTLSMLCSFLSIKDFISFLASSGFKAYAQHEEGWLVLEIGVYRTTPRRCSSTRKRTKWSSQTMR